VSEKRDFAWLTPALIVAVLCGAAGAYLQSWHDDAQMDRERTHEAAEMKKVTDGATEKQRYLEGIIQDQKDRHARAEQQQSAHLSSFARNAAGVRHDLEAQLSSARTDGQACSSRIAGIADTLGGVFDAVGEVADIAQELDQQNGRLKAENRKLAEQVSGLVANYKENHPERVVVSARKSK
jgi:hypothetical protein